MPNLYRKKPVVIEAVHYDWDEDNVSAMDEAQDAIAEFMECNVATVGDILEIETLEGTMDAVKGDYIIKGIAGEFYPCKPDIFAKTYEQINEPVCTAPKDDRELTDDELKRIRETGSLCDCHEFVDADDNELPINLADEFDFGLAICCVKAGKKVTRKGWNGAGMFVYYVPAASYPVERNNLGTMGGVFPDDMVPYREYLALKTAQGDVATWAPSTSDTLATDWMLAE